MLRPQLTTVENETLHNNNLNGGDGRIQSEPETRMT